MGKSSKLLINESYDELAKLRKSQKTLQFEKKVMVLQEVKKCDKTRQQIADLLGIGKRTLESWLTVYSRQGIEELLRVKPRRLGSSVLTKEILDGLEKRVNDVNKPFLGYWDAQKWIKKEYGVDVNYHTMRYHLVNSFGTKVKSPRKSHVKKDKEAQVSFLKTTTNA